MNKTNNNERKSDEAVNKAAQVSKTQLSAEEQKKNIPQSNKKTAEENKPDSDQQTKSAPIDASQMDVAQIFQVMQNIWKKPEELSNQRQNVNVRKDLVVETIKNLRAANKPIPTVDKRISTLGTTAPIVTPDERKLNELKIIALENEEVNLLEKDDILWKQFVRVCGSEKRALKHDKLLSQAKSKRYHGDAGYYIKQTIKSVLNDIIKSDQKPALVELKQQADHSSGEGLKKFNEGMRDLLDAFDDHLVIRCSHYNRELYYKIIRLTIIKWNPEADSEIDELVVPDESKQD